jgi:hypothetical protein
VVAAKVPIRRILTGSRVLDDAQRTAQDAAQQGNRNIFSGGVLLDSEPDAIVLGKGISFTAGVARSILHGLGRKAKGLIEVYGVDISSVATVGLYPTAHPVGVSSATHITVTPTNTGTCSVFVY